MGSIRPVWTIPQLIRKNASALRENVTKAIASREACFKNISNVVGYVLAFAEPGKVKLDLYCLLMFHHLVYLQFHMAGGTCRRRNLTFWRNWMWGCKVNWISCQAFTSIGSQLNPACDALFAAVKLFNFERKHNIFTSRLPCTPCKGEHSNGQFIQHQILSWRLALTFVRKAFNRSITHPNFWQV